MNYVSTLANAAWQQVSKIIRVEEIPIFSPNMLEIKLFFIFISGLDDNSKSKRVRKLVKLFDICACKLKTSQTTLGSW